ncbi:hypothetical protein D3C83_21460 [compost metagenome]
MAVPTSSVLPNRTSFARPHSPFSSKLFRSQSGTKSAFASVQLRLIDGGKMPPPPPRTRIEGFACGRRLLTLAPSRYLPRLTFNAVLPLPNTS